MKLRTRPLLIAAGLGGTIQIVIATVLLALSLFALSKSFLDTKTINVLSIFCDCLCWVILDILTGAIYSWLYPKDELLTLGNGILGGGVAVALAHLSRGSLGFCIGLLSVPVALSQLIALSQLKLASETLGRMLAFGTAQIVIYDLVLLLLQMVIGALFGFLGGGIVAVIRERYSRRFSGARVL